jgi:hypothetical protein
MPKKPQVALILFSNDLDNFLPAVERERKAIEEALEHFHDTNRLQVIARSAVSIEELFRLFNRYRGRISLFHFAGHAEGKGLQFNTNFQDDEMGQAVGLADLFRREVESGSLQLVFLNGCSTTLQLEGLQAAGVPSVISTTHPIDDSRALHLAQQFYQNLANTGQADPFEQPTTIQQAFDQALAYLKTKHQAEVSQDNRSIKLNFAGAGSSEAWTLYTTHPDWTLSFQVAEESKTYNERLTEDLIRAIKPYSRNAQRFLQTVANRPGWESVSAMTDNAKWIINSSFVGVLGIQLRKLFAIGKESSSEHKQRKYLFNCLLTAKRALQLLCFTLLSKLWDHQKKHAIALTDPERKSLQGFFEDEFEPGIQGYVALLQSLRTIFSQHQIELPLTELAGLAPQLEPGSDLRKACDRLQQLQVRLDKSQFAQADCFAAERQLSQLLCSLSFLADYKMVSMKNVAYDAMRNSDPHYLHYYTALGLDIKQNVNKERVNYVDAPISTDAILLFKGGYQHSINLFPFVIDVNSLTFENGAKVYFYSCKDLSDGSLNYTFLEDNSVENILYKATRKADSNINQLMMDAEKRKDIKLDVVFEQFQEARKAILQWVEEEGFRLEDEDEIEF